MSDIFKPTLDPKIPVSGVLNNCGIAAISSEFLDAVIIFSKIEDNTFSDQENEHCKKLLLFKKNYIHIKNVLADKLHVAIEKFTWSDFYICLTGGISPNENRLEYIYAREAIAQYMLGILAREYMKNLTQQNLQPMNLFKKLSILEKGRYPTLDTNALGLIYRHLGVCASVEDRYMIENIGVENDMAVYKIDITLDAISDKVSGHYERKNFAALPTAETVRNALDKVAPEYYRLIINSDGNSKISQSAIDAAFQLSKEKYDAKNKSMMCSTAFILNNIVCRKDNLTIIGSSVKEGRGEEVAVKGNFQAKEHADDSKLIHEHALRQKIKDILVSKSEQKNTITNIIKNNIDLSRSWQKVSHTARDNFKNYVSKMIQSDLWGKVSVCIDKNDRQESYDLLSQKERFEREALDAQFDEIVEAVRNDENLLLRKK